MPLRSRNSPGGGDVASEEHIGYLGLGRYAWAGEFAYLIFPNEIAGQDGLQRTVPSVLARTTADSCDMDS